VRDLLQSSPSFRALPPEKRREIARDTVAAENETPPEQGEDREHGEQLQGAGGHARRSGRLVRGAHSRARPARSGAGRVIGVMNGRLQRIGDEALAALVRGAFALVRRDLFERLGGFDERFFLYYEEVDLCRRIRAAVYRVQYWPELRVHHIGGVSARTVTGATVARSGSQLTLWRARSGLLYYRKNHGWLTAWAVNRLERSWHALRGWRAALRGQTAKAAESATHLGLLQRAWRDTLGGRVAPPRPW
jgi:GT2 family glycosyltransferase